MSKYYHYTCRHSIHKILAGKGTLVPNTQPGFQPKVMAKAREIGLPENVISYAYPVVWATDIDVREHADARKIGLGQLLGDLTNCYRVEFRFIVPNVGLVPWAKWGPANTPPEMEEYRDLLETADGVDPEHWWVSEKPITGCRLDTSYHAIKGET
jgi:hypothetical protein